MEVDFLNALRELSQASVALARFERLDDHIAMIKVILLFIADVLIDFFVIEIDTSE